MRSKEKTKEQQLLEAIMKNYGITSLKKAWAKFDRAPPNLVTGLKIEKFGPLLTHHFLRNGGGSSA